MPVSVTLYFPAARAHKPIYTPRDVLLDNIDSESLSISAEAGGRGGWLWGRVNELDKKQTSAGLWSTLSP